jgi:hypothetical protein
LRNPASSALFAIEGRTRAVRGGPRHVVDR